MKNLIVSDENLSTISFFLLVSNIFSNMNTVLFYLKYVLKKRIKNHRTVSVPFTSIRNKVNEANNKLSNDHQESLTIAANTPQTPTASTPVSFHILREKNPQTLITPIVTQNRADKTKSSKYFKQKLIIF